MKVAIKSARSESGFTLVEALVSMLVMLTVMFALYAVFDAGMRVLRSGGDKTEAVANARVGMERMEREIRAAASFSRDEGGVLFPAFGPNPSQEISFGNDLDGNGSIGAGEDVEYKLSDGVPPNLLRRNQPIAGSVPPGGLVFSYLDEDGDLATRERDVKRVRIELRVEIGERFQTLSTDVALRNRVS